MKPKTRSWWSSPGTPMTGDGSGRTSQAKRQPMSWNQQRINHWADILGRIMSIGQSLTLVLVWQVYVSRHDALVPFAEPLFVLFTFFVFPYLFIAYAVCQGSRIVSLRAQARRGEIPRWIPRMHVSLFILFLVFSNPLIWIFWGLVAMTVQIYGGIAGSLIFLIPWIVLEIIHRREQQSLAVAQSARS